MVERYTQGKTKARAVIHPHLATTGVGSLPHVSAGEAVADVLALCPDYPYWPQLPRRDSREDMYRQFSAGLPGLGSTAGGGRPGWRRDEVALGRLERVYADVLDGEESAGRWAIDPADAGGLYALGEALAAERVGGHEDGTSLRAVAVKGQVTGPVSLGLAVTDAGGRALLYEEDLMDGVARGLALRARWQERYLEGMTARPPVTLLSVDEPYLGTFGSAYFPYRPDTVLAYLRVFDETLEGVWGVHCCANTDWEFVLASPVRFVSFDAYTFGDRLVLYPGAVRAFLEAGRTLHWGIVPTSAELLAAEDSRTLARRLVGYFETLVARGVSETTLARQSMITPACGLAALDVEGARRAMSLARAVSDEMRALFPPRG